MTRSLSIAALLVGAAVVALPPQIAEAARGGGGKVRAAGATNTTRHAARPSQGVRPGSDIASRNTNIDNRSTRNSGNRINTGDININTNIDHDDHGWDWDDDYHPIARGVAFGTAAAVTAAAVGSMIYSLPPACAPYPYMSYTYYSCGGVYYEPRYQGDTVVYVVVDRPG